MRTFRILKQVESWKGRSTGFPKIYVPMERNDSPEPNFETDKDKTYFLAQLPIQPDAQAGDQAKGQVGGQARKKSLNDMEKAILEVLRKGSSFRKEVLDALDMEKRTGYFRRIIDSLMDNGLIDYIHPDTPRHPDQKYKITEVGKQQVKQK